MVFAQDEETIIAQCTPQGTGAIALLRISGKQAVEVVDRMSRLSADKKLVDQKTHTIHAGWIVDDQDKHIDYVLFLLMKSPSTFTGQDTVEITCHNNQFIIQEIIDRAISCGARLAQRGEFTQRAVLNKKIDLVQAEAINELIHAQTTMALKKSLAQLEGSLSNWITQIENHLIKALAYCQASFEFIDEELEFGPVILVSINAIGLTIQKLKRSFDAQQQIRQGIRIALIGSVNAGKSSLFNALLGTSRAIVSTTAGTTRDVIEAGLYKSGNYWTLIDTAGLRQTDDVIEQEGIKRSFQEAEKADIILLIFDTSRTLTVQEYDVYQNILMAHQNKIIVIFNKSDALVTDSMRDAQHPILVSSKTGSSLELVDLAIEESIKKLFAAAESPFLLNTRQFNLLLNLEKKLDEIKEMLYEPVAYELLAIHLQDAIAQLSALSGREVSEAGMNMVFREFCVGK